MRLFRFCSKKEYEKLMNGETLVNTTNQRSKHYRSTSVGFCFTQEDPDIAIHYLSGIVNPEMLLELEVPEHLVTPSIGIYNGGQHAVQKEEFCCTEYSLKTFKLIRASDEYSCLPTPEEIDEFIRLFL